MVWTYGGLPASDPVDEVHLLCGDTDSTEPLLQNAEVVYLLALYPKPVGKPAYLAAAAGCDTIAARFARRAQQGLGSLSISAQQQYEHYVSEAARLRDAYATNGRGSTSGLAGVRPAAPILGGGGTTVLGGPARLITGNP